MRILFSFLWLVSFSAMGTTTTVTLPKEIEQALHLPNPAPKWIAIDFWASWCSPCKEAAPFYDRQAKKWKDQGVYFVGLNQDDSESEQKNWLKEHPVSFAQIFDKDHNYSRILDIDTLPRLLVFDQDRKLVKTVRGFRSDEAGQLEKDFAVLFASKNNKKEKLKRSQQ